MQQSTKLIRISTEVFDELIRRKVSPRETHNEVLRKLLEMDE